MIHNREEMEKIFDRFDAVAGAREGYGAELEFYKSILRILSGQQEKLAATGHLTEEEASVRLRDGFALMDRLRVVPDLNLAVETFERLLDAVRRGKDLSEEVIAAAGTAAANPGIIRERLLAWFRKDNGVSRAQDSPVEDTEGLWRFLLHNALKPHYERFALENRDLKALGEWEKGYCPMCGGGPAAGGLMGEEGKRVLLCHRCGFVWDFRRVTCPFCGNTDQEKLKYMQFDGEPAYRVDVCGACKGYLKAVDSRKFPGTVILEAEDLSTPHLDLIASREGYLRKFPNTLGL